MKLFYSHLNTNFKLFTVLISFMFCHLASFATVHTCQSVEEIRTAMAAAVAGDEIVILPGTYTADNVAASGTAAHYAGLAEGTAADPIIIRSQSPDNPAILSGDDLSSLAVLRIFGDHWIVRDLKITYARTGLIFDNSNYSQAINCEVYNVGNEAIHVRDGSDYVIIDGCYVHHAGLHMPDYGEGIYIGSANESYAQDVDYTIVRNCTIGPEVKAEAFDIKEGTQNTIIEYNTVDATGISLANYADSFIDLKGVRIYVRYNTFYRNNAVNLLKGIAGVDRHIDLSSYEHVVHDNIFYMDTPDSGNMVQMDSDSEDIYAWNNTRIPAGNEYDDRVTTTCCPYWYNPNEGDCKMPYWLSATDLRRESATLMWGGDPYNGTSYEIRYKLQGTSEWTTISDIPSTTYTINNLLPVTTYDWEIKTICGADDSDFVLNSTFTTSLIDGIDIYKDDLAVDWTDNSFSGIYDLNNTSTVRLGQQSIRADYQGWGALNLSNSDGTALNDESIIRFWVKGEGEYLIEMQVNSSEYEFTTSTDWQLISLDLAEFGSPNTLTQIRFQNRSADARTVYFDQIEVVTADSPPLSIDGLQDFKLQATPRQHVNLSWTIQQRIECLGYEIERRNHSEDWKSLGFVDNKASTTSPTSYHFIDKQAALGENFYRLKLLYKDGSTEYSAIRSIRIHSHITEVSVTPNPFSDKLQLTVEQSTVAPISVLIFNANGQLVQEAEYESTADSSQSLELDMSTFASGIYYATIRCNGQFSYKKLVKM